MITNTLVHENEKYIQTKPGIHLLNGIRATLDFTDPTRYICSYRANTATHKTVGDKLHGYPRM